MQQLLYVQYRVVQENVLYTLVWVVGKYSQNKI